MSRTPQLLWEASRNSRQITTAALASWMFSRNGLEQFGEILQPLLGKSAPARDGVATACHVDLMCHESARREKNGRGRNERESIKRDAYILWKT